MIRVYDNIVSEELQEAIKTSLFSNTTNWNYLSDITKYPGKDQKRVGFLHELVFNGEVLSPFAFHTLPIITNALVRANKELDKVINIRSFLQLPLNIDTSVVDTPHIDLHSPHLAIVYYVVDSDGDTIIYNETKESDTYTVQQRVTPKQGRIVIFDGKFYHTAEQPTNDKRCIINFDLS
tara:strand:+ start:57 stop:593 length:537 start_codon:yes stop_codon:yes gene_type:complete